MVKKISLEASLSDDEVAEMVALYRESMGPLSTLAAVRQDLDDEEFRAELHSDSVHRFVGRGETGEVSGLLILETDLGRVPWISTDFFEARYPELYAGNRIYYFGALLVRPTLRGADWGNALIEAGVRKTLYDDALAVADFCRFNIDVMGVPGMINNVGARLCRSRQVSLDTQTYFAFPQEELFVPRQELLRGGDDIRIDISEPVGRRFVDLVAEEAAEAATTEDERSKSATSA